MLSDEYRYKIMKVLESNPEISQRKLASELGISLGRVNYCMQALMEAGLVRVRNFRSSKKKSGYVYHLTPRGIEEKLRVTSRFLKRKMKEYEELEKEIEQMRLEMKETEKAEAE